MPRENKLFISIILGSFVIGTFIYFGIEDSYRVINNGSLVKKAGLNIYNSASKIYTAQIPQCQANDNTIVTKVIDGDTVVVEGGYNVRLLGIDADEKGYPCHDVAKNRLEELVLNKQVNLQKDVTDVDQYKRCLRVVFIGNPSLTLGQVQNIDLELVKEGLAVARFYEPDVKYKNEIQVAEKQAIENKIGCKWSGSK